MSAPAILLEQAAARMPTPRVGQLMAVVAVVAGVTGAAVHRSAIGVAAAVAVPVVVAAAIDRRSHRIPNRLTQLMAAIVVAGVPIIVITDDCSVSNVALCGLTGLVCSGAPVLGALWVVRPSSIGGGDVKMLAVIGVALGLCAPLAAMLVIPVAVLVAGVQAFVIRARRVALGPGLALGYLVAVTAAAAWSELLGGPHR